MRIASFLVAALISSQAAAWAVEPVEPDPHTFPAIHTEIKSEHPLIDSTKTAIKLPFQFGKAMIVGTYQAVRHPKVAAKNAAKTVDNSAHWINDHCSHYVGAASVLNCAGNGAVLLMKVTGH